MTFDDDDHSDGNVDVEEADHDDDNGDLEKVPEPGVTTMLYGYPPTPRSGGWFVVSDFLSIFLTPLIKPLLLDTSGRYQRNC